MKTKKVGFFGPAHRSSRSEWHGEWKQSPETVEMTTALQYKYTMAGSHSIEMSVCCL